MTVRTVRCLIGREEQEAWELYSAAFADLNRMAAQRHLMTRDEFRAVATDVRIDKLLWTGTADNFTTERGPLLGISVITRYLEAWPLISPAYFQHHWPDHYAAGTLWYLGFLCSAPEHSGLLPSLLEESSRPARENGGMVFTDFCAQRAARLPRVSEMVLRRLHPSLSVSQVDAQSFWLWDFRPVTA